MLHKRGLFTLNIIIKFIINLYTICTRIKSTQWKLLAGLKVCPFLAFVCLPNRNCLVLLLAPKMIDARAKVDGCSFALAIWTYRERADRQCHLKVLHSLINNKCQFSWNLQIITRITKLLAKHFLNCFNQKFLPLHKCCVKIKKSWQKGGKKGENKK